MSVSNTRHILTGIKVREAMRRQFVSLSKEDSIEKAVSCLIKYQINAILITGVLGEALGVVSKTDIMTAYYATLPMETPLRDIMVSPPVLCHKEDGLESAMELMREIGIYRVYVKGNGSDEIIGLLAYPDIVGLLYRFCRNCRKNYLMGDRSEEGKPVRRFRVKEVMTDRVESFLEDDNLLKIMEGLSQYRFGAVLVRDDRGCASGVISKSDLILAYRHNLSPEISAREIMMPRIHTCPRDAYLAEAIHRMIFMDVHRIFISEEESDHIVGVLSFTDAAHVRSGSCRACLTSRIKIVDEAL
jgi:predicted transcriptional regulator